MAAEIERKFLVKELPPNLEEFPSELIEQGYLAIDERAEVRVRRRGEPACLTVKSGSGRIRVEEEVEIDERRFRSLWDLTGGRRVVKTRYLIPAGEGLTIELDVYDGSLKGLVTAEVEFESQADSHRFNAPPWLEADVTGDPRYANQTLATNGLPG